MEWSYMLSCGILVHCAVTVLLSVLPLWQMPLWHTSSTITVSVSLPYAVALSLPVTSHVLL